MNATITPQPSVTISARVSPELNLRAEKLVKLRAYRNKSDFIEEAVRRYIELLEGQDLANLQEAASLVQN